MSDLNRQDLITQLGVDLLELECLSAKAEELYLRIVETEKKLEALPDV